MIRWRTVVCCCTLLLLNRVSYVSSQDNSVFTIPITQLAQNISVEFSNIIVHSLGVNVLSQAFEGPDIFDRQSLEDDVVEAKINEIDLQELYSRIIQLFNRVFHQSANQTTNMISKDLITECCSVTDRTMLRPCCHQCRLQPESEQNYLTSVAKLLNDSSYSLLDEFRVQVRFEFGDQSGAVIEVPGINIGVVEGCITRTAVTEDWYSSTTGVVTESVRTAEGGFFLSIGMGSDGTVARALIKMTDLFPSLVEMLQRQPSSYWFVVNSQEDIFYHPQLLFGKNLPIRQLERELHSKGILNRMIRLENGTEEVTKTHLLPLGPTIMHGYTERHILSTYIYQPILKNGVINLSICVILAEEDRVAGTIITSTNPKDIIGTNTRREPFYHCSFATGATDHDQCSYYCQSASTDALSVYLTNPSNPPGSGSSTDLSVSVNLYLEGGSRPYWIQEGVAIEAARASESINPVWTSRSNTGINGSISWRYAAFPSGLLLNHPAVKVDQNLQFSHLPWYNRALAHPGMMTLSPAIPDPRKTGLIYSISKAIYMPKTADRNETIVGGPILSVVAGDVSLNSLHVTINSMEPLCTEKYYSCFLVDSAGMIIYHPSYITNIPSTEPKHFATLHPTFYSHLVSSGKNIIEKDRCNDYSSAAVNVSERSFSMFNVEFSGVVSNDNSETCNKYQFTIIPNTNVFLAIEYSPDCTTIICPCRPSALQSCISCPNSNPLSCDCPCTCHLTPNAAVSTLRQCPIGPTEQPPKYSFKANAPSNLGICYNQECGRVQDQNSCNALRECTWCFTQCTRLADCCEDNQTNILPDCLQSVCRGSGAIEDDDVSSGAIAGAVVGVIFVILVIGCLILVLVWYNFIRKEDPNAPKQENEFDFSKSRSSSDTQSQEPLSKKAANNKTDSKVEERDSNGANIVTPDTIQLSNPLITNNTTNNNTNAEKPPLPETNL